jgi:hypothetical protein
LYGAVDGIRLSHLRSHLEWCDEAYDGKYFWTLAADLEAEERPTVIAFLGAMRKTPLKVPFGFESVGCRFSLDSTTGHIEFSATKSGTGLTCATYIVLVLNSLSLPLIQAETWKPRPTDALWQTEIVELLKKLKPAAHAHFEAIGRTIGCSRIRPEEVIAAATERPWPVRFEKAEAIARSVVEQLAAS